MSKQQLLAEAVQAARLAFKPRTEFPDYNVLLAQLKGHQTKALHHMQQLAPQINLVLELRDARAPLSTSNVLIDKIFKNKSKIILYTKTDASPITSELLQKWHDKRNEKFLRIDCRKTGDITKVLKLLKKKHSEMFPPPPLGLRLMVAGMPNVGKSTLVNGLRKNGLAIERFRKVAQTGNHAGVTRNTSEIIRICSEPEILLYDTPGVLLPQVNDIKTMLSLYLVGTVTPNGIDPVIAIDYLLYIMNLKDSSGKAYKKYSKFPTNDVYELLDGVGRVTKNKSFSSVHGRMTTNYTGCALELVKLFQRGSLGKWCLDEAVVKKENADQFNQRIEQEKERLENMDTKLNIGEIESEKSSDSKKNKNSIQKRREREFRQSNQLFL
jgi:ribosome biogenesis GTPase A